MHTHTLMGKLFLAELLYIRFKRFAGQVMKEGLKEAEMGRERAGDRGGAEI